jgi:exopolysaccharide biosynthesis polyprenyl glycosylphosphotransferase
MTPAYPMAFLLAAFVAVVAIELLLRRRHAVRVLLYGTGPCAVAVTKELESRPELRCRIVGLVEERGVPIPAALEHLPHVGSSEQLADVIEELRPGRIVIALADRRGRLPVLTLVEQQLRGVEVEEAEDAYERLTGKLALEALHPGGLLARGCFRYSALQDLASRAISVAFALVGLAALWPLFPLIALAVKLDSPGPVLFRQQRVGLGGRPFELVKFRTMRASPRAPSAWATDNEGRITGVGRVLRRLRLDELPQLLHLLTGEMNLVGPRPHPLSNFTLFSERIPYYSLRYLVRPGLTGWAQVRYHYANNLAEETEKMRYDLYYIKHRSIWLDLRIVPRTVIAVLSGHGETDELAHEAPAAPMASRARHRWMLHWTPGAGIGHGHGGAPAAHR